MLDHVGEALTILIGAWRFLLSRSCRERKLVEWRRALSTPSGKAIVAAEILTAVVIGVLLPLWLILLVVTRRLTLS
jgi:hypothetical protein